MCLRTCGRVLPSVINPYNNSFNNVGPKIINPQNGSNVNVTGNGNTIIIGDRHGRQQGSCGCGQNGNYGYMQNARMQQQLTRMIAQIMSAFSQMFGQLGYNQFGQVGQGCGCHNTPLNNVYYGWNC